MTTQLIKFRGMVPLVVSLLIVSGSIGCGSPSAPTPTPPVAKSQSASMPETSVASASSGGSAPCLPATAPLKARVDNEEIPAASETISSGGGGGGSTPITPPLPTNAIVLRPWEENRDGESEVVEAPKKGITRMDVWPGSEGASVYADVRVDSAYTASFGVRKEGSNGPWQALAVYSLPVSGSYGFGDSTSILEPRVDYEAELYLRPQGEPQGRSTYHAVRPFTTLPPTAERAFAVEKDALAEYRLWASLSESPSVGTTGLGYQDAVAAEVDLFGRSVAPLSAWWGWTTELWRGMVYLTGELTLEQKNILVDCGRVSGNVWPSVVYEMNQLGGVEKERLAAIASLLDYIRHRNDGNGPPPLKMDPREAMKAMRAKSIESSWARAEKIAGSTVAGKTELGSASILPTTSRNMRTFLIVLASVEDRRGDFWMNWWNGSGIERLIKGSDGALELRSDIVLVMDLALDLLFGDEIMDDDPRFLRALELQFEGRRLFETMFSNLLDTFSDRSEFGNAMEQVLRQWITPGWYTGSTKGKAEADPKAQFDKLFAIVGLKPRPVIAK